MAILGVTVRYRVYTTNGGNSYYETEYKRFGFALNAARYKGNLVNTRRDGWFVVRETNWFEDGVFRCKGVILAQSKNAQAHNMFMTKG